MSTIYNHIDSNKRTTWFVMSAFVVLLSLIGYFIGEIYFEGAGVPFVGFAMIFSGASSFISYYNSDKIVLAISRAKEVKPQDNPQLHNLVENLCIGAGMPKPRIYIMEDSAMNAFATGRNPEHAVVCFTTGILSRLERIELEGVIAHELAHIKNYDILLMSVVSVLVGTITLIGDMFLHGRFYSGGNRNNNSGGGLIILVGILFIILSPIIATLIKMAISRNREFLADSSAALLTRYPAGLVRALQKISSDKEVLEAANGATAHMYITNPLKNSGASSFMANLFNTHPPVQERIKRLSEM